MKDLKLSAVIPVKTHKALKIHNWKIDNLALLLNKYLDFLVVSKGQIRETFEISKLKQVAFLPVIKDNQILDTAIKKIFEINDKKSKYKIVEKEFDKNFVKRFKNDLIQYRKFLKGEIKRGQIFNLIRSQIDRQQQISDYTFTLTTKSRLIVGLGSGSVLETSIKLHHIYGVPYIPASAIKGVLRAYRIWSDLVKWDVYKFSIAERLVENYERSKFKQIKSILIEKVREQNLGKKLEEDLISYLNTVEENKIKQFVEIFGNQKQKGKLIFFDAYPENFEGFDIDVTNNHYPDYYGDKKNEPPADWQNPRPITFLTVPKGTRFRFFFKNVNIYDGNLEVQIKEALKILGIGGRTALGYGVLGCDEEN